jgi:hypothetical protein
LEPHRTRNFSLLLSSIALCIPFSLAAQRTADGPAVNTTVAVAELPNAPERVDPAQSSSSLPADQSTLSHDGTASISGTVMDVTGALVPGAVVTLTAGRGLQTMSADTGAEFIFNDLAAGTYQVTITAPGLSSFAARDLIVSAGQHYELAHILLPAGAARADVEVIVTLKEQAEDQVRAEIGQRAFGIIPNFYVVYDPHFAPLTTRLKYKLAIKAATDPVTFGAAIFIAGINQAADTPGYTQGAKGYGQRVGAAYANGASDILIGGAILPSLLHQDPRYFYQGTGTKRSRAIHALESPFIAKGDDGRPQFNYSSIGGDLASASLSNLYYPPSDRGPGLVFSNALITTSGRMLNALAQEFILRKLTTSAKP